MKKTGHHIEAIQTVIEPALAMTEADQVFKRFLKGLADRLSVPVIVMLWERKKELITAVRVQRDVARKTVDKAVSEVIARYEKEAGKKTTKPIVDLWDGLKVLPSNDDVTCYTHGWLLSQATRPVGYFLLAAEEENGWEEETNEFARQTSEFFASMYGMLETARSAAVRDPMTGLHNRLYVEQQYLSMARACHRYNHTMAVIMVDIDYFKSVNDTYGHSTGDQVLVEFSDILKGTTRESDALGRYGGDEFVILFSQGDERDTAIYGERLRDIVRQTVFCKGDHDLHLTISMGIAFGKPSGDEKRDGKFPLLIKADTAIYAAKKTGRDRIHVWNADQLPKPLKQKPLSSAFKTIVSKQKNARILLVDDEPAVSGVLAKGLRMEGYACETVSSSRHALEKITTTPYAYDLVITDIQMPEMDGTVLIREIKAINASILSLAISGKATVETAVTSLRQGAYDFIEKPIHLHHLFSIVERALAYRSVVMENQRYQNHLSEMVEKKSAELDQTLEEVKQSYAFTLESLISLLDAREKDFGQHSKRVRDLSMFLARKMGLDERMVETIGQGALLHDIGKIAVPDHILLKSDSLTADEWDIMREHVKVGYHILSSSDYFKNVAEIVYSHHEYFNGEGYPEGLKKKEICLGARIFAVIDAYDAIRSTRTYKAAQSPAAALAEIEKGAGSQFDPRVVEVFKANHTEIDALFLELHE